MSRHSLILRRSWTDVAVQLPHQDLLIRCMSCTASPTARGTRWSKNRKQSLAKAATVTILCMALSLPCETWNEHAWRDNWQSFLHWSQPAQVHDGKVPRDKRSFILQRGYPSSWPRDVIFLDFSEVFDTPSQYSSRQNIWHTAGSN